MEEAISNYTDFHLEDPLIDYEILSETEVNSSEKEFYVREIYHSGYIIELPHIVKKTDDYWKFTIDVEGVYWNEFEVIDTGEPININPYNLLPQKVESEVENEELITPQAGVTLFNFSGRFYHFLTSSGTFTPPGQATILYISSQVS
ncbi:hypothetical protein J2T56_000251 [Natronobacillus azotifigens]|uniref:Uncharacterized protein n=1 Tax=Natronobacillus azotifigens TaxID=472978 RepID=A0A9J6R9J4_9BACI|nr:hypothetical protein [Natronobacillus azotifigens]MCZ0701971.1 hypothetical protein [Natronobacillus azotifigens]